MGDIHFNVFFYNVFKSVFWHFSIIFKFFRRNITGANKKPPFAILSVRICPAKSYNPPNKYSWICRKSFTVPTSIASIKEPSNSAYAFCLLFPSIASSDRVNQEINSAPILLGNSAAGLITSSESKASNLYFLSSSAVNFS